MASGVMVEPLRHVCEICCLRLATCNPSRVREGGDVIGSSTGGQKRGGEKW